MHPCRSAQLFFSSHLDHKVPSIIKKLLRKNYTGSIGLSDAKIQVSIKAFSGEYQPVDSPPTTQVFSPQRTSVFKNFHILSDMQARVFSLWSKLIFTYILFQINQQNRKRTML